MAPVFIDPLETTWPVRVPAVDVAQDDAQLILVNGRGTGSPGQRYGPRRSAGTFLPLGSLFVLLRAAGLPGCFRTNDSSPQL